MKGASRIVFVSTMSGDPWGGSELLWSATALRLAGEGRFVAASVCGWPTRPAQLLPLLEGGVRIHERRNIVDRLWPKPVKKVASALLNAWVHPGSRYALTRWLRRQRPDLVCISSGWPGDEQGLMNTCLRTGLPYVLVLHSNAEQWWPDDMRASRLIEICRAARRVFFVSERNRELLETQMGVCLDNAEVIRNPYNVRADSIPAWPSESAGIRLACVGRLAPSAKGQDLILRLLSAEPWRSRPIYLSLYGTGPSEQGLRRLADRLGLAERVQFCGHVADIEHVWETHHALVLPSRYEGLPVVIVEAMLCGRPIIATDAGGNSEVIEDGVTGFIAEAPTMRHLGLAMERAWTNRHEWERMGRAGAVAIRRLVPADPAAVFARRLSELAR